MTLRRALVAVALLAACGARDAPPAPAAAHAPAATPAPDAAAAVTAPPATIPVDASPAAPAAVEAVDPAALAEQLGAGPGALVLDTRPPHDWRGAVVQTIQRHARAVRDCYSRRLAAVPRLAGKVTARFEIGRDGRVTTATASGMDERVAMCIADVIRGLTFPPPPDGPVSLTFPFVFSQAP